MEGKKITISFKKAIDYKMYPATGVWGGPTPDGHILMNVVVEHGSIPSYHTFEADETGKIDQSRPVQAVSAGDGEREILCGVLFSANTARAVANWLIQHADKIEGH